MAILPPTSPTTVMGGFSLAIITETKSRSKLSHLSLSVRKDNGSYIKIHSRRLGTMGLENVIKPIRIPNYWGFIKWFVEILHKKSEKLIKSKTVEQPPPSPFYPSYLLEKENWNAKKKSMPCKNQLTKGFSAQDTQSKRKKKICRNTHNSGPGYRGNTAYEPNMQQTLWFHTQQQWQALMSLHTHLPMFWDNKSSVKSECCQQPPCIYMHTTVVSQQMFQHSIR